MTMFQLSIVSKFRIGNLYMKVRKLGIDRGVSTLSSIPFCLTKIHTCSYCKMEKTIISKVRSLTHRSQNWQAVVMQSG